MVLLLIVGVWIYTRALAWPLSLLGSCDSKEKKPEAVGKTAVGPKIHTPDAIGPIAT